MTFIHYCIIITLLVIFSITVTYGQDPASDLLLDDDEYLNNLQKFRSRRHTEAFDLNHQPNNPSLHKRKRGFLSNLKQKILSFITGKNKKNNQRPSKPEEAIEDEDINNLELFPDSDTKIQEKTSSTRVKTDKNNQNLVSRLQKMLATYENTLKSLKKHKKPHHKKHRKHNNTVNSDENNDTTERYKRFSEKKPRIKVKSRYFRKINLDHTTEPSSAYPIVHSHVEDNFPQNFNYLEESKRRDKILKNILRISSLNKKKYESAKPYDIIGYKEKIHKNIKESKPTDDSFSHENLDNSII